MATPELPLETVAVPLSVVPACTSARVTLVLSFSSGLPNWSSTATERKGGGVTLPAGVTPATRLGGCCAMARWSRGRAVIPKLVEVAVLLVPPTVAVAMS